MKKILLLTFTLLFILASCAEESTGPSNTRSFLGGTEGVTVDFVEGEPPEEVTDGGATPFTVTVRLENQGETEISASDVLVTLKGIDAPSFGVTSAELSLNPPEELLENDINPDTGEAIDSPPVYVTFPQLNFAGELSGNSDFPLVVDVCYKYTSMATSRLCIKEDLFDTSDDSVCSVTGHKDVQNSGAPVQITGFEEFSAGQNAVSFSFDVENVGGGLLAAENQDCDQEPINKDIVRLTVDTGLSGLTCSGLSNPTTSDTAYSGSVKLTTGKRQVRCTQQLSPADQTDKIMIVDLAVDYDYQVSKQTSVLVKHI